jgi:hypothetical protein
MGKCSGTELVTTEYAYPCGLEKTLHEVLAHDGFQISADGKWIMGRALVVDSTKYLDEQYLVGADGDDIGDDDTINVDEDGNMVSDTE